MTGSTPLLQVRNLTLRFAGIVALNDVSFDLGDDELLAVIGPNGAGKTSLFNCLNQVYRPEGSIVLDGKSVCGLSPQRTAQLGIARTFQNLALFSNLTVIDNIMLGRHHLMKTGFVSGALWVGRAKREEMAHRERCEEIMDLLELAAYRGLPVGQLPYGVQKRIELGRALAMQPRVLLLDEPVAGMNLEESEDMVGYILEVRSRLGVSTIMVEHDMAVVMDIADRVVALNFGQILADGTPEQVQRDPAVIAAYLGVQDSAAARPGPEVVVPAGAGAELGGR